MHYCSLWNRQHAEFCSSGSLQSTYSWSQWCQFINVIAILQWDTLLKAFATYIYNEIGLLTISQFAYDGLCGYILGCILSDAKALFWSRSFSSFQFHIRYIRVRRLAKECNCAMPKWWNVSMGQWSVKSTWGSFEYRSVGLLYRSTMTW